MEVAGLTVSVASLASIFESAVHCFEYIQLAKSIGVDVGTCNLKLDNTQLQLTRWGEAVRLGADADSIDSLGGTAVREEDVKKAGTLLGHIVELFKRAEHVSSKYRAAQPSLQMEDSNAVLSEAEASLHQRIRKICHRRQKEIGVLKKAKWSLYEKKHFDRLMDDIQQLVHNLVELFPATVPVQQSLCEQEAAELQEAAALIPFKEIVKEQDKWLEEAITKMGPQKGPTNSTVNNYNSKIANQVSGGQTIQGGQTINL